MEQAWDPVHQVLLGDGGDRAVVGVDSEEGIREDLLVDDGRAGVAVDGQVQSLADLGAAKAGALGGCRHRRRAARAPDWAGCLPTGKLSHHFTLLTELFSRSPDCHLISGDYLAQKKKAIVDVRLTPKNAHTATEEARGALHMAQSQVISQYIRLKCATCEAETHHQLVMTPPPEKRPFIERMAVGCRRLVVLQGGP